MRNSLFLLVPLFMCGSAALAQTDTDGSFPAGAPIAFEAVHRLVSADFVDPALAEYRQMSLVSSYGDLQYVCGWVSTGTGEDPQFYPFYVDIDRGTARVGYKYMDPLASEMVLLPFRFVGCLEPLGLSMPE